MANFAAYNLPQLQQIRYNIFIMDKYEIPFINTCIKAFGHRFSMSRDKAYEYLKKYSGMAFLYDFYDVEHLQSIENTVDDLIIICKKNGGQLA